MAYPCASKTKDEAGRTLPLASPSQWPLPPNGLSLPLASPSPPPPGLSLPHHTYPCASEPKEPASAALSSAKYPRGRPIWRLRPAWRNPKTWGRGGIGNMGEIVRQEEPDDPGKGRGGGEIGNMGEIVR